MAGKVPDELAANCPADTFELKTHELSEKYNVAQSTVKDWQLDCKRWLTGQTWDGLPQAHSFQRSE